jgi:phospholipid transport system substrate-binding protein
MIAFARGLAVVLLLPLLALVAPLAAAAGSPTEEVRAVADRVVDLLRNAGLDTAARRQRIRETIAPHFDFPAMSQSILALSWKSATEEQRQRFIDLFGKLLENTYITAMESYAGETVRYGRERVDGDRATVDTFIVRPNGPETPVTYRLRLTERGWMAYDVIAEGVSLVSNYRTSFRSIVEKDGMEGLLSQLRQKVGQGS